MYVKREKEVWPEREAFGVRVSGDTVTARVYAPNADAVAICGDFNGWSTVSHSLKQEGDGGIWSCSLSSDVLSAGSRYKFAVKLGERFYLRRDPYAFSSEFSENGSSVVADVDGFPWTDGSWIKHRERYAATAEERYSCPINVYQMDLHSWMLRADGSFMNYREIAEKLVPYVKRMGFTHVELVSVLEYPDGGRRTRSYFAPSSRFGSPYDMMCFINKLHEAGVGVILEWSPAKFADEAEGLCAFDGSALFEYADGAVGADGTRAFDLSSRYVRDFLISAAEFWIEKYHVDGLSADTVYPTDVYGVIRRGSERAGDYADFFSEMNREINSRFPNVLTVAEGGFPSLPLTGSKEDGGLDFSLKRNIDWARELLDYVKLDPVFRKYYHTKLTYPMVYAYGDRFMLSVSKELFEGSSTLLESQFGELEDKLKGARIFQMYAMAFPGKKIFYMGSEFGQRSEYGQSGQLEWDKTETDGHGNLMMFNAALNEFYLKTRALWDDDFSWDGFRWILPDESEKNLIAYERRSRDGERLICAVNFSGVDINEYPLMLPEDVPYPDVEGGALPTETEWRVAFSSNEYGNFGTAVVSGGMLKISLPARSAIYMVPKRNEIF